MIVCCIVGYTREASQAIIRDACNTFDAIKECYLQDFRRNLLYYDLTNKVIIDQHFRQRDRIGRLLAALAFNPFAIGIGLDEDTGAFIDGDDVLEVVGSGCITVVDLGELEHSSMDMADEGDAICMTGIKMHLLDHGSRYDLKARTAHPSAHR